MMAVTRVVASEIKRSEQMHPYFAGRSNGWDFLKD